MILGWVAFIVGIFPVGCPWLPVVSTLALVVLASELVKPRIHRLCFLDYNGLIGKPIFCVVVCLDGGPRLWPFHFFECVLEWYHCIGGNEESV